MAVIGRDKALGGLARILSSLAAGYALIATMSGADPTAASADLEATGTAIQTFIDLAYKAVESWPILVAAVLPLYSKFYDAFKRIAPWLP